MTDLDITKLCAEAIGAGADDFHGEVAIYEKLPDGTLLQEIYNPLRDDAQAMGLVKKLRLDVEPCFSETMGEWMVSRWKYDSTGREYSHTNEDLNRAICLCVANMQGAK